MKYNAPPNLTCKYKKCAKYNEKLDGAKKEAVNDYIPRIPPSWLKYDRKVKDFVGIRD